MARLTLSILLILLCFQTSFSSARAVQKQEQVTADEVQAARELADRFHKRMRETGDFAALFDELFAADFMERYIKQQRWEIASGRTPSKPVFFAPGFEYAPELLEQASLPDWKRFYAATYNFLHYSMSEGMKRAIKAMVRGEELESAILEDIFPAQVRQLFEQHPILNNFIVENNDSRPISSVEEMRSTIAALEQANALMRTDKKTGQFSGIATDKLVMATLKERGAFDPELEIAGEDVYGFPRGTRVLQILTPSLLTLTIVNIDGQYKIVWVSPCVGI